MAPPIALPPVPPRGTGGPVKKAGALEPEHAATSASTTIAVASSVVLAGLVAWDLATVKSAVRRHQERRMSVTPLYDSVRHGPGLVARVTF